MKRIMGLDIGDKRIGVAVSDLLGMTAQGKENIVLEYGDDPVKRIQERMEAEGVTELILGLPRNMDGTLGERAEKTRVIGDALAGIPGISVGYFDERLTSVAAEKLMIADNVSRKKRKRKVDMMAAVIILQNYLDSRSV